MSLRKYDFLGDWMGNPSKNNPLDLSKSAVQHDKWDKEQFDSIKEEMAELDAAEDRLTDVAEATGGNLFADSYYSLVKADPKLEEPGEMRPSFLVNRTIMEEAMGLGEYNDLRNYCVGDEIGAALANIAMEPELEVIYDKLEQERKMAEELRKQEQELDGLGERERTLDEMMDSLDNPSQKEIKNYQKEKAKINEHMDALRKNIGEGAQELQDALDKKRGGIRNGMKKAMDAAGNEVGNTTETAQGWGLDRGQIQRMSPKERIELARRLNSDRFRKISQLFGPMQRLAFAEQMRKTTHARDEVYDISMGSDLARVLPMELASIRHPVRRYEFFKKFVEQQLLQYELRGEERVAKGGIIFCEDGSGSMSGEREMWAKAVGLCLLNVAKAQNRSFYGIHFGGPRELATFDFRKPEDITFDRVMEFAEIFFGGGTDFMSPLSKSVDLLREEFAVKGCVNGDIVFATDGACAVNEDWLADFKKEQARMGFRVWGVVIGGTIRDEPLATICDNRVFSIKELHSGEEMRDIFRSV
jgi:uncharacterized protein with von Willebrand factor type A (vWA) domain